MIYKTIKNDIEAFCEKVNAEKWTDFVGAYSEIGDSRLYGGKHGGSDVEREGAEYIAQRLKEIGVGRVEFVKTPASRYQFNDAELKVIGVKEPMEIRPYGYRSPGTDKDGITAPLIDAGTATRDELKNIDIKGKIAVVQGMDVLEAGNLIAQMEACIINGAAAVLIYAAEDILNEDTIRVQTPMNVSPIPIVGISMRHAKYLKGLLEQGEITVKALEQLLQVDMAGISYYFGRQTAERMCRQINGKEFAHTRTWASGKELKCSSHYELMSGLKTKIDGGATDFDEEIKLIGKAAKKEMIPFIIELKKEFGVIRMAIKKIEKLEAEI